MQLEKIINKNYASTCKRGKITLETTHQDFINKIMEELRELQDAYNQKDFFNLNYEIADIILVCFNYCKHFNIPVEYYLEKKIQINYDRAKENKPVKVSDC
jgi:NTP pyrophosphatase (non-canonical NTP hydrolase)